MKNKALLWHMLFWVVFTAVFTFVEGGYNHNFDEAFYLEISYLPLRLLIVYFNYYYLLPRFLLKNRINKYIIYSLVTVIIASFAQRFITYYIVNPLVFPDWTPKGLFEVYRTLQAAIILITPMIFLIGLTTILKWAETEQKVQRVDNERLQTELKYLKNQLNPHFFFNTLNNLYGLAQEKSDKTAAVVLKLSELMSYMLYETNKYSIPLDNEIEYVRNYISLEEQRYGDRFSCELKVTGNRAGVEIPPMLILPFIENSFKHGINKESAGAWINLSISVYESTLHVHVSNSLARETEPGATDQGGVGIKYVERRLHLLYPNGYDLIYGESEGQYSVSLQLDLTKLRKIKEDA